jgi:DNA primase
MNSPVAKIKERLSIEEVVSTYIKVERAGANLKARCPFHSEKTPSFFISPDRGTYYCFGCGASGDIFSFIEEFEGLDFKGALKLLAERAGIPLSEYRSAEEGAKEKLFRIMEEAALFYQRNLESFPEGIEYLKNRGLSESSIKAFRIGYVKSDWREVYNYLLKKGFTEKEIEEAGLAKRAEKGMYDRFRGRIMFPIADSSGRVIAFSGRLFVDDGKSAKYLNSPDTPIFSKSAVLYGLDKAKESIRKNNFSILVEGQMDLVLSHQSGYRNTIASSGTALSDSTISKENVVSNLGLVRRLSNNIVLAFDGDKAGFNASLRAGRIALSLGMDVKVAKMPAGVDPADLISKEGADAWKAAVRDSKHIVEFLLDKTVEENAGDPRKVARAIKEVVLPYVDAVESSIEKSHFVKKISDKAGIPENSIHEDLKKVEQELKYEKEEVTKAIEKHTSIQRKDRILRRLLGIALWQKDQALEDSLGISDQYKDLVNDLIFEAEVSYGSSDNLDKEKKELLSNLEDERINEELLRKMQELRIIKDKDKEAQLLKEIQELNKQKHEKKK